MEKEDLIVVPFKPKTDEEVLLKYYRGYPISYVIYNSSYKITGYVLRPYEIHIERSVDTEVTKKSLNDAIKSLERWIDRYIADREIITDIAKGNYISPPVKVVEKKKSWIGMLLSGE